MAAKKRTKHERERDLEVISREYLNGKSQLQVAEMLGVTSQQVCYDLKTVHKRWLEASLVTHQAVIAKELAKIDAHEQRCMKAWEKSCADKTVTHMQKAEGLSGSAKASKRTEQRDGNPQFLWGIQWCIEARLKLLLPKTQKVEDDSTAGFAEKMLAQEGVRKLLEESKVYGPPTLTISSPEAKQA